MYERIRRNFERKKKYKGKLIFVIGTGEVGPSKDFANMEEFKRQNSDLLEQFYSQILSSDIVVADLTTNNPNVHLELGIALSQNKNILRVTGRNIVEVASDIKGYYVDHYPNSKALVKKLQDYLDMFLRIKNLPLENGVPFYKSYPPITLDHLRGDYTPENLKANLNRFSYPIYHPLQRMRDGELKVTFAFTETAKEDEAWFGAYFRSEYSFAPWLGDYIVTMRQNGVLGLPKWPRYDLIQQTKYEPLSLNKKYIFHLKVDGNHLSVWLNDDFENALRVNDLENQSYGYLAVACFAGKVRLESIETVCRDTIEF
jgi:hypothetical protein